MGLLTASEAAYISEVARYKVARGVNGQIRGDVAVGYLYGLLYYVSYFASAVVPLKFYGSLGPAAPGLFIAAIVWVGIVSWLAYLWRLKRDIREAEALGFDLRKLRNKIGLPERASDTPHQDPP